MKNPSAVGALQRALDDHVRLVRELVETAQQQQRNLIAFDLEGLESCTREQKEFLSQLEAAEKSTRTATEALREELGIGEEDAGTIRTVAEHVTGRDGQHLLEQCGNLRSLIEALGELNRMSTVQAERGIEVMRAYSALLASGGTFEGSVTYSPHGKAQPTGPGRLSRSA